jgi:catechol 2,3-dioxygenase-like lactoylglutathione lyase family enzyme
MTIVGYDHIQLAIPHGGESVARGFYGDLLGMDELSKPPALAARGGAWFRSGAAAVHLGVEDPFRPARKAHPAFLVSDLRGLRDRLTAAGHLCTDASGEIPGVHRFHTHDPFGNRLEFQQA